MIRQLVCLIVGALFLSGSALALDTTKTGFYYPIGERRFDQAEGGWLARDPAHGGKYFTGFYHNGIDMMTRTHKSDDEDSHVYAIAHGEVILVSYSDAAWGKGNAAIHILHEMVDGRRSVSVSGHVRPSVKEGDIVTPGMYIGYTGPWDYGDHLHFGIYILGNGERYRSTEAGHYGWGRIANPYWDTVDPYLGTYPFTNGFVNPIEFIETHKPFNPASCPNSQPSILDNPDWACMSINREGADLLRLQYGNSRFIYYPDTGVACYTEKWQPIFQFGASKLLTAQATSPKPLEQCSEIEESYTLIPKGEPSTNLKIYRQGEDHTLDPEKHAIYIGETLEFRVITKSPDKRPLKDFLKGDDHYRQDLDFQHRGGKWEEIADLSAADHNLDEIKHVEKEIWTVSETDATEIRFRVHVDNNDSRETTGWYRLQAATPRPTPDLRAAVSTYEGSSLWSGQYLHPVCTVDNPGAATPDVEKVKVRYYIGGLYVDDDSFLPHHVAPGGSRTVSVNSDKFKLTTPGPVEVACEVDPEQEIPDLDRSNNISTMIVTVVPGVADIATSATLQSYPVKLNKDAQGRCHVSNLGNAHPTQTVVISHKYGGKVKAYDHISPDRLAPGTTTTVDHNKGQKMNETGLHDYSCYADPQPGEVVTSNNQSPLFWFDVYKKKKK